MSKAFKRSLVYFMSLVLPLGFSFSDLNIFKFKNYSYQALSAELNSKLSKLVKDGNWQILSDFWKNLNHIVYSQDYKRNENKLMSLEEQLKEATQSLNNLKQNGMLTAEETNFLSEVINERFNHIKMTIRPVTCYEMTVMGGKIQSSLDDLENQYDLIESLYSEGKVNSTVFKTTETDIARQIKFIHENNNYNKKPKPFNEELIEYVILLNN